MWADLIEHGTWLSLVCQSGTSSVVLSGCILQTQHGLTRRSGWTGATSAKPVQRSHENAPIMVLFHLHKRLRNHTKRTPDTDASHDEHAQAREPGSGENKWSVTRWALRALGRIHVKSENQGPRLLSWHLQRGQIGRGSGSDLTRTQGAGVQRYRVRCHDSAHAACLKGCKRTVAEAPENTRRLDS